MAKIVSRRGREKQKELEEARHGGNLELELDEDRLRATGTGGDDPDMEIDYHTIDWTDDQSP